jgi:ABC-type nitrate/sulfonate/bicarbonate transport system substrate-binding protein
MSVAPISSIIRLLLVSFGTLSLLLTTPQAQAQDKVLRIGTLKLIHGITPYFYEKFAPPGYTVEVIPFESPTDGKNAVLTGTVDTCIHGIAAFLLGAAAGEPVVIVAAATNRGMGIVADAKSDIKTIKDLKGKRVAIFPGSTQRLSFSSVSKRRASGFRSATWRRRWPAATSMRMSGRSQAQGSALRTGPAG